MELKQSTPVNKMKGCSTFQQPEEGQRVQWPKRCDKHGDKDEDNSPKNVNNVPGHSLESGSLTPQQRSSRRILLPQPTGFTSWELHIKMLPISRWSGSTIDSLIVLSVGAANPSSLSIQPIWTTPDFYLWVLERQRVWEQSTIHLLNSKRPLILRFVTYRKKSASG